MTEMWRFMDDETEYDEGIIWRKLAPQLEILTPYFLRLQIPQPNIAVGIETVTVITDINLYDGIAKVAYVSKPHGSILSGSVKLDQLGFAPPMKPELDFSSEGIEDRGYLMPVNDETPAVLELKDSARGMMTTDLPVIN